MIYLSSFRFPTQQEEEFFLNQSLKAGQQCYNTAYPFTLFNGRALPTFDFEEITILYGGNGSGKTTLLNAMAEALRLSRQAAYNRSAFFDDYVNLCRWHELHKVPRRSMILTSDDVFEYMLDLRAMNNHIDNRREALFEELDEAAADKFQFHGMQDYDRLKKKMQARRGSHSQIAQRAIPANLYTRSNGENSMLVFSQKIDENALYLLDEPENSLSPDHQIQLSRYIYDSARFYNCQFIIATHSPFLLAMKGARIYDLDTAPVTTRRWTDLENVRMIWDFFQEHKAEFEN